MQIKILNKKINLDIPIYHTKGASGLDLQAGIIEKIILKPNSVKLVPTGIAIYINDKSYAGLILPRSGLGHKKGLILGNGTGLIDSDYQGELFVSCWNRSDTDIIIEPLMRFAQLIIIPVLRPNLELVDDFDVETSRKLNGFGSTGV